MSTSPVFHLDHTKLEPAGADEMRRAVMYGKRIKCESGITMYALGDTLYVNSERPLVILEDEREPVLPAGGWIR